MGVVGRLDQYASMLCNEFDDYSMSENLFTYSEQFDNASWLRNNYNVTANAIQAPDGTLTADKLIAINASTFHDLYKSPGLGQATYTLSIFAKAAEQSFIQLRIDDGVLTRVTMFNLLTGSVSSSSNVGVSTITSYPNGWYRCSIASRTSIVNAVFNSFPTSSNANYSGNGVSGIYIWGAQLETGLITDYTPTTTTAINRVLASSTNTNITGLGTYYSSGFDENIGFTTFLPANVFAPYDPVYDEFSGTSFGAGQGRYMRQYTDKSAIVYNEIDEVTDFRDIVRSGLVLDLDAAQPLSYKGTGTTWTDLSGNGNTGTLVNMDSTNFNSANGGYLTFDGTNEYVTCGDPSSLNFGTGNFTISFVVYTTVYGFQGGSYVGKGNGTTIGFDFRDGSFFVYGTSGLIAQGAFAATLNVWEHHTIVYDSSSSPYVKFYKNGAYTGGSTTNTPANISSINTSEPLRIGLSVAGGPTRYFNGRMPLVQAYNRALTGAEITQNYNALKHRFGL